MLVDTGPSQLNAVLDGPTIGPKILLIHGLGTHLGIWDNIVSQLSDKYSFIRFDLRGHGQSSVPKGPYTMGRMARDTEVLIEKLVAGPVVVAGVSVGAQIAIALAAKRPKLVRGLVLANSAVKIGTPQMWKDRAAVVQKNGTAAIADTSIEQWFGKTFRQTAEAEQWKQALIATPDEGYAGMAAAIGGADLISVASTLTCPTSVIAGSDDGTTPPDIVREMADLIPTAEFNLIRGAGHLSPVDGGEEFARILSHFVERLDAPNQKAHLHNHH